MLYIPDIRRYEGTRVRDMSRPLRLFGADDDEDKCILVPSHLRTLVPPKLQSHYYMLLNIADLLAKIRKVERNAKGKFTFLFISETE